MQLIEEYLNYASELEHKESRSHRVPEANLKRKRPQTVFTARASRQGLPSRRFNAVEYPILKLGVKGAIYATSRD
jgi:hypothetical protein